MEKPVTVLIDLMAGSCGKGKIAGYLAQENNYAAAISNAMPNSGHIYVDDIIGKREFRNIPISIVNKDTELFIGAGSAIDLEIFKEEYDRNEDILGDRTIYVHPMVPIIEQRHKDYEKEVLRSGSTFKGGGAVLADKVMRNPNLKYFTEYKNAVASKDYYIKLKEVLLKGQVLIEGSQGADLSLNHSGHYPYVTSRNCSSSQMLADSGINPMLVNKIIGIIRPYPIRISNSTELGVDISSGNYGDSEELSWYEINERSRADWMGVDFSEKTTVTKRPRRVFEMDIERLKHNIFINGVTEIVVNFAQHLDAENLNVSGNYDDLYIDRYFREYINYLERELEVPVTLIGTGAKNSKIITRQLKI